MPSYEVTGVRTETSIDGTHEHVSHLQVGLLGMILPRKAVVADLRLRRDSYYAMLGGRRADLEVVQCPRCAFRTFPDLRFEGSFSGPGQLSTMPRI